MSNLDIWDKVSRPPVNALKQIKGGRLAGMTDINPQWRLQIMTETFGAIGQGWYYKIIDFWKEEGATGEVMAFVHIHLFTCNDGVWSKPISGVGGSALVAKERDGLRANDEAYKMALTDALSVAMKQLGVAADIYAGLWDGTKYRDAPKSSNGVEPPNESAKPIAKDVWDKLPIEEQNFLTGIAIEITEHYLQGNMEKCISLVHENNLDAEEQIALWSRLDSKQRSAIKTYKDSLKKVA